MSASGRVSLGSAALLTLLLSAGLLPSAAHAQTPTVEARVPVSAGPTPAAVLDQRDGPRRLPVGVVRSVPSVSRIEALPQSRGGTRSNVALMGVGAAGVVIGSVVGGNGGRMLVLGGAVVGLVGLYRYLRAG